MAEEIGALRAVLALESAAFDKGVASARRQLTGLDSGFKKSGGQVAQFGSKMRDLDRFSRSGSSGLQNVGYQVQDFAVQVGAGTSASQALAQQLPQLLSGFGLFGIALGTASAVLIPLIGYLFQAGEATKSWANELSLTGGSISGVQGAVSALESVQRQYVDAITAQGGASSASAALVISNSAREFAARKQLLAVEIELLRIRGQEQAQARANISDGIRLQAEARARGVDPRQLGLGGTDRAGGTIDDYVNIRPRNLDEMGLGGDFAQQDILAVQKLNAELELTNLTIERTDALMNSTFETISGTGSATAGVKTGGGAPKAAKAVSEVNTEVGKLSQAATQLQSSFGAAFVDLVTGAKSAQEAVGALLSDLARMLANQAFQSLLGGGGAGIFGGIGKALGLADGAALSGGRVQAFAAGGIVSAPTIFPMANGAGLMGEAGPEAIMPLTRIGGKLGVRAAGGGNTTVQIDARYATEGTAEMIVKAIQRAAPGIVKQSVSANRAAGARGY
jgi:hypothetical protein